MLAPRASGRTRLQTITKTKTAQLHSQTIDVSAADRLHVTKLYQIAQEGMRSGLYVPNRSSFLLAEVLLVLGRDVWRSMGVRWSRRGESRGGAALNLRNHCFLFPTSSLADFALVWWSKALTPL
jgi:hypothetical protein